MKQSLFESRHQPEWQRFAQWLEQMERCKAKATDLHEFPAQYRRLCQQLALTQERGYSSHLVDALQQLALRGHQQLYRHPVTSVPRCWVSSSPASLAWCANNGRSSWLPACCSSP